MPTTCAPTERQIVTMRNGVAVSLEALQLLWRLEDAGLTIRLTDDDRLQVGPSSRLTSADDLAIRQHRDELVALVGMCEELTA